MNEIEIVNGWNVERLNSTDEVLKKLQLLSCMESRWVFRGTQKEYDYELIPSIDRDPFDKITDRKLKIEFERESIEVFRATVKLISKEDERKLLLDNIPTLMMMQHYGAPTRLLDWSFSPYSAAYFAVCDKDNDDGLIWAFDQTKFNELADQKWKDFPEMIEGGFKHNLSPAFNENYLGKWCVCQFLLKKKFPRILAQDGLFTFVSQFGEDHARIIQQILSGSAHRQIFRIRHEDKFDLRQILKEKYGRWHAMIYPDAMGAAEAVKEQLKDNVIKLRKSL
jgi:hypothetical protein